MTLIVFYYFFFSLYFFGIDSKLESKITAMEQCELSWGIFFSLLPRILLLVMVMMNKNCAFSHLRSLDVCVLMLFFSPDFIWNLLAYCKQTPAQMPIHIKWMIVITFESSRYRFLAPSSLSDLIRKKLKIRILCEHPLWRSIIFNYCLFSSVFPQVRSNAFLIIIHTLNV